MKYAKFLSDFLTLEAREVRDKYATFPNFDTELLFINKVTKLRDFFNMVEPYASNKSFGFEAARLLDSLLE